MAASPRIKQDEKYRKDMYLAFVVNALHQKANGFNEPFDELVNQFSLKRIYAEGGASLSPQLRIWLSALSHVISRLEHGHVALVEAIVNMPWTTMDSALVKSYIVFTEMLLSARPEYLSLVLSKITQGFTYQSGLQALDASQPETSSKPMMRRVIYDRLHYLLRHLLSLIPTLPSALQPLLVRRFPHKRQSHVAQATYVRNLLRVTEYCPELADRILAIIIDHAIQIDVEIQVELEELEEEEELAQQDQEAVFEIDPFDLDVGLDDGESDSETGDEGNDSDYFSDLSSDAEEMEDERSPVDAQSNVQHIQDMVKKLDIILKILFDHFHHSHVAFLSPPTPPRSASPSPMDDSTELSSSHPHAEHNNKTLRRSQFHTLLSIFDRIIIRTFKSRYTQFLIFWFSSLDPEFSDIFLGLLVSKALLEHDQPIVTRAAASSYIASFISRAQFVDRAGARRVMGVLCNFLKSHLDVYDAHVYPNDPIQGPAQHAMFYSVTQAVFLIFCFRWRDMMEEEEEEEEPLKSKSKWMKELNVVGRVVTSQLNPLQVCSPNVVLQFARVAHATDFIYCYSILESNRRSESRPSYQNTNSVAAQSRQAIPAHMCQTVNSELNTFFPFDPYKLPRSNSYIQDVYREWSSVAIDNGEEEQDDEEAEAGDGYQGQYLDMPLSGVRGEDKDDLGVSFEVMSISPIRPKELL